MYIKRRNTVLYDVHLMSNSFTIDEIMGEQTLTLNFLSRNVIDFEVGDYVECEGEVYKIRHKEKIVKREKSLGWEYNIPFYSSKYDLEDVVFFLNGKPEYKKNFDYYTGTARQILELIVKNMNREDSGWKAGSCIESRAITVSFKDKSVGNVLDDTVKQLETECWISQKTVSIGKRKYESNGIVLAQGEGLGFTELEVSAVDDERPTTVIFPYGSDKNLGSDYGADYLMLPDGLKELSKNTEKYGRLGQKKIQFDHIFPQGEFTVTEKIDTLTLKCDVDFNLKDCLIDDVEVIVTFQSGGLAGYDLAIVEGSWDNSKKQFKLKVNKEENALTVPGDINFSVGDKFILTGLKMPQSYIDKAEKQLLEEAQTWLDEHCEKRVQLKGKCDEGLFRQLNLFIAPGQMVGVYSEQLKIDREIRVTKVKRYIENDNKPAYRYELTLSDFLQGNGFKDLVNDVDKFPDEIEDKVKPVREWTKRSWRDVMETLGMMFDPEGDYFTELIKQLAVHTAQLIVGTNSQQMDLVGLKFIPNADNDPNYFKNTAGKLVHLTVSETGVREWSIPAASFRLSNSLAYYVYAKCPKEGSAGSILVSERQIKLEAETGYYHFWVGVLNTPENSVRSWNPNYGYTEIAGQTITTGVIKDKLAKLIIDLVNARITAINGATIEGKIKFTSGSSGLYNTDEWPSINGDINDAYGMGYNAFEKAKTAQDKANNAYDKATAAEKAAADKAAETERTVKNNLAYQLGFKDYAAMVAAGRLSSVLIDGGVISAAVVDAAAIVAKGISAEIIQALKIVTGNLTVTSGAKIADFVVDKGRLKYVGSDFGTTSKVYIGNVDNGSPDTSGARITALGIDANFYASNASAMTTSIKNMLIDNVSTSNKKTSLLIKTSGGAKNTAMSIYGNVAISGDIANIGTPVSNTLPNSSVGFDHNTAIIASATSLTLPTGESLRSWFGDNPNAWTDYGTARGGTDGTVYDLYAVIAPWHPSSCTIYGNSGGNEDYSGINGTPLYGIGVTRTGYGQITLQPGRVAHFKKVGRQWFCIGVN